MQRAVANRRLGASGTRAVTRPAHRGPTTIGNHVIHRLIQAGSLSGASSEFAPSYPPVSELLNEVLGGPGQSLDSETRNFMESRFGYDFSQVKLHTDTKAAESAAAVNAKAYTVGDEIVFGAGEFSPGTVEGRRLLAHELTHVVQQPAGPAIGSSVLDGSISISEPADPSEQEAEQVASQITFSETVGSQPVVATATAPSVSRQDDNDDQQGGGLLGVVKELADPALELAGDVFPEAGIVTGPLGAALSGTEAITGESTFDKVKGALGFATGTVGTAAEMGGFSLLGGGGEAAAGSMAVSALPEAAAAGELGTLGLAGPAAAVLGAGLAGAGLGAGMGKVADSSYTKTGAFGTDESTGQNQSGMDWGASWGTGLDKLLGNTEPSIAGGIAAGVGGIVGGIGGAAYGAANWLGDQF
jgi:hypothetical protein